MPWELFELLVATLCMSKQMNHLLIDVDSKHCANIDNPAFDYVFHKQFENLQNDKNKKNILNQMTFRIQKHIDDSYTPLDIV